MAELELLNEIKAKAAKRKKTVVLPESHDDRVLLAAEKLVKENVASVITIGNEDQVRSKASELKVDLKGVRIIDPLKSEKHSDFSNSSTGFKSKFWRSHKLNIGPIWVFNFGAASNLTILFATHGFKFFLLDMSIALSIV